MARFLYISSVEGAQARGNALGCGWMPAVPPEFQSVAVAPCAIVAGAGTVLVLPEPTTKQAVAAAAAPILSAEQAANDAAAAQQVNADTIRQNAINALTTNSAYLDLPPIPASPTNAQLIAAVRAIRDQTDALTRQANGLIRLAANQLDSVSGTQPLGKP